MGVEVEVDLPSEDEILRKAQRALAFTAFDVEGEAKRIVPVDTGRLRASIIAQRINPNKWEVSANTNYASFVEFGTVKMIAQPYIRPAARKSGRFFRLHFK